MDEIIIRQEKEKDFNQIQEVVRLAFLQMEESDHTEHKLVERLHQSDAFIPELSLEDSGIYSAVRSKSRLRKPQPHGVGSRPFGRITRIPGQGHRRNAYPCST